MHRRLGITTIYVTHDQTEAMTMGDRIAVLNHGKLQQLDRPLNLFNHPTNLFVAGFIGSPAMNFVRGTLVASNGSVLMQAEPLNLKLSADQAQRVKSYVGRRNRLRGAAGRYLRPRLQPPIAIDEGNSCTLEVDVTEPMGATVYAYLNAGKHCFIADLKSETKAKIGGRLDVAFDMAKVHLFDPETEAALA